MMSMGLRLSPPQRLLWCFDRKGFLGLGLAEEKEKRERTGNAWNFIYLFIYL